MSLKKEIDKALAESYSLGQFNISTLEQIKGIVEAAKEKNVPVILGTSRGESQFLGFEEAVALRDVMRRRHPDIYLNLDHGRDLEWIEKAIEAGYDMVHFDGSKLPIEENIEKTKKVVRMAKEKDVVVEGEVGHVGGASRVHDRVPEEAQALTSTETLVKFISETKVDLCAFSIGNIHGVYSEMPEMDFGRLEEIASESDIGLVMHGGSGISTDDLKRAIENGVVKINVNTDLRNVWKRELVAGLEADSEEVTPYKILSGIPEKIKEKTIEKINIFYENRT